MVMMMKIVIWHEQGDQKIKNREEDEAHGLI